MQMREYCGKNKGDNGGEGGKRTDVFLKMRSTGNPDGLESMRVEYERKKLLS